MPYAKSETLIIATKGYFIPAMAGAIAIKNSIFKQPLKLPTFN